MPWLQNNEVAMSDIELSNLYYWTSGKHSTNFYRSRIAISTDTLTAILMPVVYKNYYNGTSQVNYAFASSTMPKEYDTPEINIRAAVEAIRSKSDYYYSKNMIYVINTSGCAQTNVNATIASLKERGFEEVDVRTALTMDVNHNVHILKIKVTTHSSGQPIIHTVVFSNEYKDELFLRIGAVLPIVHGMDVPLDIMNALLAGDKLAFMNAMVKEISAYIEVRNKKEIEDAFNNFAKAFENSKTTKFDRSIKDYEDAVERELTALRDYYKKLNELQMKRASTYWDKVDSGVQEFVNYIRKADLNNITKLYYNSGNNSLVVMLVTKLRYWEPKYFENYLHGIGNCVTGRQSATIALLKNIFIDKTVEVTFHTEFTIRFNEERAERSTNYTNEGYNSKGLAHTHIYYHNCWGDNAPLISKALSEQNYIIAWEQIKATLSGLNLTDTVVFRKFCENQLESMRIPAACLTLVDTGEQLTIGEFKKRYPDGYTLGATQTAEPVVEVIPRTRRVEPTPVVLEPEWNEDENEENEEEI